jgi:hypothetical protein
MFYYSSVEAQIVPKCWDKSSKKLAKNDEKIRRLLFLPDFIFKIRATLDFKSVIFALKSA